MMLNRILLMWSVFEAVGSEGLLLRQERHCEARAWSGETGDVGGLGLRRVLEPRSPVLLCERDLHKRTVIGSATKMRKTCPPV